MQNICMVTEVTTPNSIGLALDSDSSLRRFLVQHRAGDEPAVLFAADDAAGGPK